MDDVDGGGTGNGTGNGIGEGNGTGNGTGKGNGTGNGIGEGTGRSAGTGSGTGGGTGGAGGADGGRSGGGDGRRVAVLVGELLGVLAEKVRSAGPDAVRVLTEEELQRHQLTWFRAGWEEHARATGREDLVGPDRPPARLLPFPGQPRGRDHPSDDDGG